MTGWHILTGEYPPQSGGVSDYTRLLASKLAQAGDEVHVWAPACLEPTPVDKGVEVHRLPGRFGPRTLTALNARLKEFDGPRRVLVQYVPQAFGWKGLNLPFCLWLWSKRRDAVWVMFHEVYFPLGWKQSPSHNLLGAVTRLMAALVTSAAERKFVSIPAWTPLLSSGDVKRKQAVWLPVPSNVPVLDARADTAETRARLLSNGQFLIGHFGTYGSGIADYLLSVLPPLLTDYSDRRALLLGRGSEEMREKVVRQYPELSEKVCASGSLPADEISGHISACDLMIQPYVDGVSSRRTSVMACLAHGLPVVTTKGRLTESLWAESESVMLVDSIDVDGLVSAVEQLLADAAERERLGAAARVLYQKSFDIRHVISALRDESPGSGSI